MSQQKFKRHLSKTALGMWQRVRDEGGWWSGQELCDALGMTDRRMASVRSNLLNCGYLVRRGTVSKRGKPVQVGVTVKCRVPLGQTLEPEAVSP